MKYVVHELPVGRSNQNYIAMTDLRPFGFRNLMEQLWLTHLGENRYQVAPPCRTCLLFCVRRVEPESVAI
jgi:hypothetical protein